MPLITIKDDVTKLPVPYASLTVKDSNGQSTGQGTTADVNGKAVLDLNSWQTKEGTFLVISSTGYIPAMVEFSDIHDNEDIFLDQDEQSLPNVTVTTKLKSKGTIFLIVVAILVLVSYMLYTKNNKNE